MISTCFLRPLAIAFATVRLAAGLDLPPDVAEAFRGAGLDETGYLSSRGDKGLLVEHVKMHWKELLEHLDEVPSGSGTVRSAVMVVGTAAEELPPVEYLDFLDHYLTAYSRGGIEDEVLQSQLSGMGRKNRFVLKNWEHPRIQALLRRATELVPKENVKFQKSLKEDLAGERAGWIYVADGTIYLDVGDGTSVSPPEILPGTLVRRWGKRLLFVSVGILAVVAWKKFLRRRRV